MRGETLLLRLPASSQRSEPSRFCPSQRSAGVPAADGHSQAQKRFFPGALWSLDFHVKGDAFARFYIYWKSNR